MYILYLDSCVSALYEMVSFVVYVCALRSIDYFYMYCCRIFLILVLSADYIVW